MDIFISSFGSFPLPLDPCNLLEQQPLFGWDGPILICLNISTPIDTREIG
jgi:hypothetical protein